MGTIANWLKQAVASYDAWCQRIGLTEQNRRCCAPVRYDSDDPRHPDNQRSSCSSVPASSSAERRNEHQ
ncbi:hypothetical protein [Photobacterium jeanii]|uniref:hypothetical protein n=1 Tax=Photobacterium jeanii TaxID=858640 RepID=UPI0009FC9C08|nr:hypothetical protein [Photobacterium jeanii]PST89722.1 hypothetical protein C9I91_12125 [Photobacterium jeanii]